MDPIAFSFSRLQAFQRCPWLYHLVFDQGWRSGPKAPSSVGHSLHNTLAAFLDPDNADHSLDRLLEIFDSVWVNEGFSGPQETFQKYEEAKSMLEKFFALEQGRTSKILFTEKKFDFSWEGFTIQGTVDRIDQAEDGSYHVVEYKTRGEAWTPERIASNLQMTFYAWGVAEGLGLKPLRLKYYFLSSGKTAEADRTPSAIEDLKSLLRTAAGQIRSQNFKPNFQHCAFCEIGRRCSFYKESNS
jgi:RecB family exonuclease